jgi:hypothetical protein
MRRRSAALLVSGVLAVGGVLLPSIQQHESQGDTRILGVVVNGGRPIVLGPAGSAAFSFSVTAEDDSGIRSVDKVGLWGSNYGVLTSTPTQCVARSKTVSVCTGTSSVDVTRKQVFDDMAGDWFVQATANGNDGDRRTETSAGKFSILKAGQLTSFGSPPSATRGSEITVKGQLDRPDWRSLSWEPSPRQEVRLEFCAKGCRIPVTAATVRTDAQGMLSATVRVSGTGTYTWVYPGTYWADSAESYPAQVTVG